MARQASITVNALPPVADHPRGSCLDRHQIADHCERYYGAIYRYIAYRVSHRTDAEDLASEVFVRALESRAAVRVSILGLLYRIAENLITDYYRREARRKKMMDRETDIDAISVAGNHRDPAEMIDLAQSLKTLTGEQYQVIVMRFLEGYPIEEVAAALGKTPGAVKALQFRALTKLRETLVERPHETI